MGVDTKLYINTKWKLDDIISVIERLWNEKPEINSHHEFAPGYFTLTFKNHNRMIHCHAYVDTPIGTATLLDMGANDQSHDLFISIAGVLGGLYMDNDCDGDCKMLAGKLWNQDGLQYFLNYAVIHDNIDSHNAVEFLQSMNNWYDKYGDMDKPKYLESVIKTIKE